MDKRFNDTYFDAVLMQAFFDAAKSEIDAEPTLKELQEQYPTPKKVIRRVKNTLKAEQYKRPLAVLYLQRVAVCILAVVALSFVVLLTNSKVQAAVSETVVEWYEKYIIINLGNLDKEEEEAKETLFDNICVAELEIGYIPDGFMLMSASENEAFRTYTYESNDAQIIVISISNSEENQSNLDNENTQYEESEINGMIAYLVYSEENKFGSVIFGDSNITVNLSGDLSKDELVMIAENIKPKEDVLSGKTFKDLEINYLPDDLIVIMEEHDDASSFYLYTGEEDPEITLNINICASDVLLTYIDNEKNEIEETIINGNKAFVAYSEEKHMGIILWGNTDTSVFVSGSFDKDTLLKIARNIYPVENFLKDKTINDIYLTYVPDECMLTVESVDDTSALYLYEGEEGRYVSMQVAYGAVTTGALSNEEYDEMIINGCTAYVSYSEENNYGTVVLGDSEITITISGTYDRATLIATAKGIEAE